MSTVLHIQSIGTFAGCVVALLLIKYDKIDKIK